ncbi:MAG: zinc-ribbon domain-containing protein [Parvularculaceae bacterium]|nr:zinc-ribbon domain-containing protein [Parvularculaceae bacterium]
MIITCPNCTTRYDVDDRRFSPDGRSVRCAECDESWFVPAPQPIEDLVPLKKQQRVYAEDAPRERAESPRERQEWREEAYEETVEEPLFDPAPSRSAAGRDAGRGNKRDAAHDVQDAYDDAPEEFSARHQDERGARDRDSAHKQPVEQPPMLRDKKGRFIKVKKEDGQPDFSDEDERDQRSAKDERRFGRADRNDDRRHESRHKDERAAAPRTRWGREFESRDREDRDRFDRADLRADRGGSSKAQPIVDADFEDVDAAPRADQYDDPIAKGFGRKAREDRRRATALARMEDLEPVAERIFNEEFFTALRVQPKELERAIRKARRRAEAREKNRLTPLRAIGWSAWIGAIAACAFVAYSYRNNIVAMFPNAKTAYDAVGIEANPYGLKIEGVTHRVAMSAQGPVIEILGRLRNDEKGDVAPPLLQAEALGADGELLSRWTFSARAEKVRAGAFADFSTRAPAPEGVAEVLLSFAPAEGVKLSVDQLLKTPQN